MTSTIFILLLLGLSIGTVGTMIGSGGGFILIPVLILIYPEMSPAVMTAISLAIVTINSFSGTTAYIRSKRIDYKAGIIFALATIPGSIIGVHITHLIPKNQFDLLFGFFVIGLSLFLFTRTIRPKKQQKNEIKNGTHSIITDHNGRTYQYQYNLKLGIIISLLIGLISPILGIGGGSMHVPAMTEWLGFPVHISTATSHFILAIRSITSVIVHLFEGNYQDPEIIKMIGLLAIGIIPGAIIGAKLSERVNGKVIIRILSISLIFVGIKIIINSYL